MQAKAKPRKKAAQARTEISCWRPTEEDFEILERLKQKLGATPTQIYRQALRKLAEAEGLRR